MSTIVDAQICVCVCFFFFKGGTYDIWKFPGEGSNWSCSCQPSPQPRQHGIQAVSDLHHSLWQRHILNQLSKARDGTHTFMDTSQVCYCWPMTEQPPSSPPVRFSIWSSILCMDSLICGKPPKCLWIEFLGFHELGWAKVCSLISKWNWVYPSIMNIGKKPH